MSPMEGIDPDWLITLSSMLESLDRSLSVDKKQSLKRNFFQYLYEGLSYERAFQKAWNELKDRKLI